MSIIDDTANRRGFLKCMTWAGSAMVWTMAGGIPRSRLIGGATAAETGLSFAQVSDSHLGFDKPVNANVTATFQDALGQVIGMDNRPAFLIHTGDITHLSKPGEFDTAAQLLGATKLQTYTVPGEHDILEDDRKSYLNHYGKGTKGDGWYSFNAQGVHFIGLVNVVNLKGNGLGDLGHEQIEWLEKDVKSLSASTPIVVFAHVPLWIVYQDWGWGTVDGAQALSYLKRFGSVTVLNGHIHQVMQKVEGHVAFHTARSTAFPPRRARRGERSRSRARATERAENRSRHHTGQLGKYSIASGDRRYPAGRLKKPTMYRLLQCGLTLACLLVPLMGRTNDAATIKIDNFTFSPEKLTVAKGTEVTWTNDDDIPHTIVLTANNVRSKAIDTDKTFTYRFDKAGTFSYICGLHPHMHGEVVVR